MSETINKTGDFVTHDNRTTELREEIVRCRDCKYYDQNDAPSEVYPDRYWCDRMTSYMPADGFCSFGKRKVVGE